MGIIGPSGWSACTSTIIFGRVSCERHERAANNRSTNAETSRRSTLICENGLNGFKAAEYMVPSALRQGFLPTNRGLEVRLGAEGGGRSEGGVQAEVSAVKEGGDFGGFGEVTDKIEHGAVSCGARGAEREAENGAEMVFELAGDGAFDGPVAGIVDTRSHFVGEKLALVFEEFESEDAGVFHGFEDAVSG